MTSCKQRVSCYLLAVLLLTALPLCVLGKTVSRDAALDVACGWLAANPAVDAGSGTTLSVKGIRPLTGLDGDVVAYFVDLDPRGYIVVPGDDLVEPVLCYSTTGVLADLPQPGEPLYDLLAGDIPKRVEREQSQAFSPTANQRYSAFVARRWSKFTAIAKGTAGLQSPAENGFRETAVVPVVNPIIKDNWNQSGYARDTYNAFTPKNYVTGCVATAMGMIMHFYSYPESASGSNTIAVDGVPQQASFDSTYDWTVMPTELLDTSPQNQIDAVARLLVDCGTSVSMSYGPDGSGAITSDVANALKTFFRYDSAEWMDGQDGSWSQALKDELEAGYPAEFSIRDTAHRSGHAIVCDGWGTEDGADRFHLNLGWAGSYNDWYAVPGFTTGSATWDVLNGYVYKIRAPGVSPLSCRVTGPASPTKNNPIVFHIKFSRAVTGLTADEITVTGGIKGELTGADAEYDLPVTPTADGMVTCQVPAGAAVDANEKTNETSNLRTIVYDGTVPTCTISAPESFALPEPIEFVIHFSEPVTGFGVGKLTVTGGTKGTLNGSGQDYSLLITPTALAPVSCQAVAGAGLDTAGNASPASNLATVAYEPGAPIVKITAPTGSPTYTTSATVIDLAGTAFDLVGIASLTWSNNRGGSGNCLGTTSWSASGINLQPGQNAITIAATNNVGVPGSDTIYVDCSAEGEVQVTVCPGIFGLALGKTAELQVFYTDKTGVETPAVDPVIWLLTDSNSGTITDEGFFQAGQTDGMFEEAVTAEVAVASPAVKRAVPIDVFTAGLEGGFAPERWWGRTPPNRLDSARDVAVDPTGCVYVVDNASHRVQQFDLAGNYVKHWGTKGSGEGQFESPCGIAIDSSGSIYVADTDNDRIQVFNAFGQFDRQFGTEGTGDGQLQAPEALAVDSSGNVYVADTGNSRVMVFDENGAYLNKWGSNGTADGQFRLPGGIAIESGGSIYVSDREVGTSRIQKFTAAGVFVRKWGSYGTLDGQFEGCLDVAVDDAQHVFAIDGSQRVQRFDNTGRYLGKWGTTGSADGQFSDVRGLTVDSSGLVYVSDVGNARVQKFDSMGIFAAKWGYAVAGLGQLKQPDQVAVDASNNVYVADTQNCRIQKFDSDGKFLMAWGSKGVGNGQFNQPTGIAIDAEGFIYVADTGNHRVQRFSAAGNYDMQWGTFGTSAGQFNYPTGVAATANYILVSDAFGRVQKFCLVCGTLSHISSFYSGGAASGSAVSLKGIATDGAGHVYVTDATNNRVQVFDIEGAFLGVWGTAGSNPGQFRQPSGIAVANGFVYVADLQNSRIQKFDTLGVYKATWGGEGDAEGEFASPAGVAVDSAGNVYVADTGNNRVQKFQPLADAVKPTILFPTTEPSYCSNMTAIDIGGVALQNTTIVTWRNNGGQPQSCTGTINWLASAVPLQDGLNTITITAAAPGGSGESTLVVLCDTEAPDLSITTIVPGNVVASLLALDGTASDNNLVASVEYYNATTNVTGLFTGTTAWSGFVPLAVGANELYVRATDSCGNTTTVSLGTIEFADDTPPVINPIEFTQTSVEPPVGMIQVDVTDEDDVATVTWSNNRGGSGSCAIIGDPQYSPGLVTRTWRAQGMALAVGANVITVTATDATGHESVEQTTANVPDITAPTVVITGPTANATYATDQETLTLSGTASDDVAVASVAWSNDRGGSGSCTGSTNWTAATIALKLGENVITIEAQDATGNPGTDTITITRNGTDPPTISILSPTTDDTLSTTGVSLDLSGEAGDDVGVESVTWSNDRGGSGDCTGTTEWSVNGIVLEPGENVITVTAHDTYGKTGEDVITVTFTDETDPTVEGVAAAVTNQSSTSITGYVLDDVDVTSVSWTTDRGKSGTCAILPDPPADPSPEQVQNGWVYLGWLGDAVDLEMGQNIITVSAVDSTGNVGTKQITVVRTDGSGPSVLITTPTTAATYATTSPTINVAGTAADDVSVSSVVVSNSRGGGKVCTGTTTWTAAGVALKPGVNVLTVTAYDGAGNTGTALLTVTLSDGTNPTVTITGPTSGAVYSTTSETLTLSGTASDNVAVQHVSWSLEGGFSGDCTGTTSWAAADIPLMIGQNVVTVTATDTAGNSGTDTLTITLSDGTAPAVSITGPTSDAACSTGSETLNISGTASDSVGVTSVSWINSRGGSGTCVGTASWSATGITLQTGQNVITVSARDAAGNVGTDTLTVTFTDGDVPVVTITSPTTGATYSTTSGTISLAGSASDNVSVSTVAWSNDRGGSGTCTGTSTWSATAIPVSLGDNVLTVSASDASGNTGHAMLMVTVTDTTNPTVAITAPTSEPSCTRTRASLSIGGTASDNVEVALVAWSADKGGSGNCTGTTAWSASGITLALGDNRITVTVHDTAGNISTATIDVNVLDVTSEVQNAWIGRAMVSLPIIPDVADPKIVVGFMNNQWAMYRPDHSDYVTYGTGDPNHLTWFTQAGETPGRGFWTMFSGTVSVPTGTVPRQDLPATIHLKAGWNIIGQPFVEPVAWSTTAITVRDGSDVRTLKNAAAAGWVKDFAWGWTPEPTEANASNGSYYMIADPATVSGATGVLAPWQAYWLKATRDCDLIIPAP